MLGFNAIIDIDISCYPIILICYDFKRRLTNPLSPHLSFFFLKYIVRIFDHEFYI